MGKKNSNKELITLLILEKNRKKIVHEILKISNFPQEIQFFGIFLKKLILIKTGNVKQKKEINTFSLKYFTKINNKKIFLGNITKKIPHNVLS